MWTPHFKDVSWSVLYSLRLSKGRKDQTSNKPNLGCCCGELFSGFDELYRKNRLRFQKWLFLYTTPWSPTYRPTGKHEKYIRYRLTHWFSLNLLAVKFNKQILYQQCDNVVSLIECVRGIRKCIRQGCWCVLLWMCHQWDGNIVWNLVETLFSVMKSDVCFSVEMKIKFNLYLKFTVKFNSIFGLLHESYQL